MLSRFLLVHQGCGCGALANRGTGDIPLEILNALLDRGVNPTLQNINGLTPLIYLVDGGKVDIVARLLQVRATIDVQDLKDGDTALHHAC